ncbi:lysosomal proton-coupled steroid conjugate and bile acid symporter SLC46A3 [Trichechus manatus latirostris]|uniref:Lysosomal proton-coupled steroid conjugate and bile acid symporter SLC46A3 n=1 Tax=Trichechus manatus latirostris TaxID=127582 RepID=A0A2Y9RQR0_TRIMA|nr:lysosomal proton-coupled steroid conjugate and bile acid symporter SLC46A3 [Trichechus manatus latirostris]XP_023594272.1 lysosomal proton-coupled steroid conjugate and bile acid symporter SLC46A3 [Trichechus manatus latirostris]XP_023594273.1 lysosomal proton-coupled steroid conjugate and bile acid symporter SLC46A3 [Trichechus manatus latirostris]XP_023594274.1 lysosomal proton-coupled steroid conjugate and bile acid symporter SLC46A3 [Trichechus manatus latirostris]
MKVLFVEPAIFLSAFAMSLTTPLTTQYVYRRIWEETSNYSIAFDSNISECEKNKSSPIFVLQKEVQKKVSLFSLQMDLSGLIPGVVSTFLLLSHSDHQGRKLPLVLSSVGALATSVWLCLLAYFALPFQLLIASTFIGALCGNSTTFWGACFAYIVDQCKEKRQKTIRIAIVDFILGLTTGLSGLSSGYFIRELGFVWSFLIVVLALTVNLIYILFFLGTPVRETPSQNVSMSCSEAFKNLFYRTYMLFKNISGKRKFLLCLLLFTMITYFLVIIGIFPVFILYELDSPLCWNEVFIGYGSALGSVSFVSSFLGIWIFSYCMDDIHMAFIGLFTTLGGMIMTAFAKTTLLMFLVRLLFIFMIVPLSVLRSMLSKVVCSSEQGTLFACISVLETLGGVLAVSAFNGIYSATVAWYSGFTFLLSAALLLIPAISLCIVKCTNWNEGSYVPLVQEESGEDASDR